MSSGTIPNLEKARITDRDKLTGPLVISFGAKEFCDSGRIYASPALRETQLWFGTQKKKLLGNGHLELQL